MSVPAPKTGSSPGLQANSPKQAETKPVLVKRSQTNISRDESRSHLSAASDDGLGKTSKVTRASQILETLSMTEQDVLPENRESHHSNEAKSCWNSFKGIIFMLIATIINSLHPSIFTYLKNEKKVLRDDKSAYLFYVSLLYSFLNGIPLACLTCYKKDIFQPLWNDKKLIFILVIRGVLGGMVLFVQWNAIEFFEDRFSIVTVIMAMAPIFVYINAWLVLGEKLGWIPIINAFIAMGGVAVMNIDNFSQTDNSNINLAGGLGCALTAMLLLSWVTVVVRMLREVHILVTNMAYGIFGFVIHGIIAVSTGHFKVFDPVAYGFTVLTASLATVSLVFFNLALHYEAAGVVSLVRTSDVIFNFIYQALFFKQLPKTWELVGAAIVLLGVICVTIRKIVQDSPEDSKLRKYLGFLLH